MHNNLVALYTGSKGSGKTLTAVKDAYKYYLKGFDVYTNMSSLNFAYTIESSDMMKLGKDSNLYNCVILVDEVQILFDSRRSMKKENLDFSNFIQQVRKRRIRFLATTQYKNSTDRRLRDNLDILVKPKILSLDKGEIVEVVYYDLTSIEDILDYGGGGFPKFLNLVYIPNKIYELYDTEERIVVGGKNKNG